MLYNGFIVTDKLRNQKRYDGNTLKFGISVDGEDYIVKLAKNSYTSLFSEYVASRFITSLGIDCHKVWLGYYYHRVGNKFVKEMVVILKDFTSKTLKLRSYKDTRQSSEDTDISVKTYTYRDVIYLIDKHTKLSQAMKQKMVDRFWEMFICDAILANRDRHHGNWGYLTDGHNYYPAPIYDNAASLFPDVYRRIDEFESNEFMFLADRAEKFPASLFCKQRENGDIKRVNYYEMLGDLRISKTLARKVGEIKEKVGFELI